ncbi:DUF1015 family protein [Nonomuraea sp. NPDC050328]|uniref:DUF1015 family protein n=1 Tax=Nonomuraea sp. NPDC050328 TaxID=3364361 RepID=UPI003799B8D1
MATPELPVPDGLVLRPFRGVRFAVDDPAQVTSPPYDLISEADVEVLLSQHPYNVVRLILPSGDRYDTARDTLREWLDSGVLVADPEPALYVYEQQGPGVLQRGLIGDIGLAPGAVLPHEDVMPGPVADRLALMSTTQANLEPIFLLHSGGPELDLSRPPLVDALTSDGVRHRLWAITDPAEIEAINAGLRGKRALIADGHHRYATYRELQSRERAAGRGDGPWDFGLALLVDSAAYPPDLKAIHRVIPGLALGEAAARAKGAWRVQDIGSLSEGLAALDSAVGPAFLLGGAEGFHLMSDPDPMQLANGMRADRSERWNSLNTAVLDEFVLPKVWGMRDDEESVRIVHHDAEAAVRQAAEAGGTAVILKALDVADVMAVAEAGERVPRKSTSFGPKPRTGLVLRTFATG